MLCWSSLSALRFSTPRLYIVTTPSPRHYAPLPGIVLKMEDKLIVAVCGHPELYNITSPFYKIRTKKDLAWRKVAEEVGLPGEF